MVQSYYKNLFRKEFEPGKSLPKVSTDLDSVRAYQFEIHFFGLPPNVLPEQTELTLAAKQVSPVGFAVDPIEVPRINDRLFYPGRPGPDELVVTFDNLYNRNVAEALWNWFKSSAYDPITGEMTKLAAPGGPGGRSFKANKAEIIQLDNTTTPHASVEVYGVFPVSWRNAEHNYATNEFHTIEMTFRYDFMDMFNIDS
jgi:hypothetical protein